MQTTSLDGGLTSLEIYFRQINSDCMINYMQLTQELYKSFLVYNYINTRYVSSKNQIMKIQNTLTYENTKFLKSTTSDNLSTPS